MLYRISRVFSMTIPAATTPKATSPHESSRSLKESLHHFKDQYMASHPKPTITEKGPVDSAPHHLRVGE